MVRKNSVRRLVNLPFQAIFVMQAAQHRLRFDSVTGGELVPVAAGGKLESIVEKPHADKTPLCEAGKCGSHDAD